jgi:hypothetical protein
VFNIRLMQVLGASLAVMAVISVAIFEFAAGGDVSVSMEGEYVRAFKGEEYETVMTVESRASGWVDSMPPTVNIGTGKLVNATPLGDGRMRLRFLGTRAGRAEGFDVGISLSDPLRLFKRVDQFVHSEFLLDTLPLSLLAPAAPRKLMIFGFGEQPTGYPGPGHELYGLNEYNSGDTKDIIWKRVAKSPNETLIARVREANVREVVKVGVVRFAERGDDQAAWIDSLCEALGYLGKEVFEMGASLTILYNSPPGVEGRGGWKGEAGRSPGPTQVTATDVVELAEAVMSCSVGPGSYEIGGVVSNCDLVITGVKELEHESTAKVLAEKPMLLISEEASPNATISNRSVVYSGREGLFPLIRKVLER